MQNVNGLIGPVPSSYRMRDYDIGDITPELVKSLLRGVKTGKLEDQHRLFRVMFDTWPRLQKDIGEVSKAVARLEFCVMPYAKKGEDPTPEAQKIADICDAALWKCQPDATKWEVDFTGAVKAALDAYATGHEVMETLWQVTDHEGTKLVCPRAFAPIPAKYYSYPTRTLANDTPDQLMLNPEGLSYGKLEPFPDDRFIIAKWSRGGEHPIYSANLRCLAKYWLGAYFGLGWLLQYAQLFGIPMRTIEAEGAEAIETAKNALEDFGAAGWAVIPKGTKIEVHAAAGGGEGLPQNVVLDIANEACDILFLGQTLTTSQGDRGSQALGTVHNAVRDDVLAAAGDWVANLFGTQLFRSIIKLNLGDEVANGPMPFLVAKMPEARDEKAIIERIEGLQRIGVEMEEAFVYEMLGVPKPATGATLFKSTSSTQNEQEDPNAEEDEEPEQLEAARKGSRGKTPSGQKLKIWPKRSGAIYRK